MPPHWMYLVLLHLHWTTLQHCVQGNSFLSFAGCGTSQPSKGRAYNRRNRKSDTVSPEERLLTMLLRDYDQDARGVAEANDTVTVKIEFILLRIQGLDERSQVLSSTGLIITDWHDERLKWDPVKYNNLTDIVVKPGRIWLPELALMNGADEQAPAYRNIRVLVSHNGDVHWEPGGIFMTTCDIDIRYFPFDEQACPIQVGAWAYYSSRMNLTNASHTVVTHDFRLNGEWDVYFSKAEWKETVLPCCPNTRYSYVEFTIFLRRRYTFYIMNIILPCTLLSILVMMVFCLPPDAGEKISLGISVLLAFTVFLLMVAENVPRTSLHIPIMVIYLTCTMALGTISVCLTVLVLNLHHRDPERRVPKWAKVLVLKYLARLLRVRARKPRTMADSLARDGVMTLKSGIGRIARDAHILRPMLHNSAEHEARYTRTEQVFPTCKDGQDNSHQNSNNTQNLPQGSTNGSKGTVNDNSHDWRELAHVLDRVFFWTIFLFMSASIMIIALVPMYREEKAPT